MQNVVYVVGSTMGGGDMPKPQHYPRAQEAYLALQDNGPAVDETDGTPVGGADELSAYFDAVEGKQ